MSKGTGEVGRERSLDALYAAQRALSDAAASIREDIELPQAYASLAGTMADNLATICANLHNSLKYGQLRERSERQIPTPPPTEAL